ncbi:MAG: hypothetical protein NTU49_11290 [Gammaproteobacteria bacterium]|nr:hypothetical protein [Gammaproteobacteria bacterium]
MSNKRILWVAGTLIASCFTITSLAQSPELPQETVDACKSYIINPSAKSGQVNAAALQQCYNNVHTVCESQLSGVPNCQRNLNLWRLTGNNPVTPAVTPNTTQTSEKQAPTEAAAPSPMTESPAPTEAVTPPPTNTSESTPAQTPASTEKKEPTPSINW